MTQASLTPAAQVPSGASHVHVAYDTVTFYKRATYGHGIESGQPFVGWHSWTDGRWLLEHHARSDRFVTLEEWLLDEWLTAARSGNAAIPKSSTMAP